MLRLLEWGGVAVGFGLIFFVRARSDRRLPQVLAGIATAALAVALLGGTDNEHVYGPRASWIVVGVALPLAVSRADSWLRRRDPVPNLKGATPALLVTVVTVLTVLVLQALVSATVLQGLFRIARKN